MEHLAKQSMEITTTRTWSNVQHFCLFPPLGRHQVMSRGKWTSEICTPLPASPSITQPFYQVVVTRCVMMTIATTKYLWYDDPLCLYAAGTLPGNEPYQDVDVDLDKIYERKPRPLCPPHLISLLFLAKIFRMTSFNISLQVSCNCFLKICNILIMP